MRVQIGTLANWLTALARSATGHPRMSGVREWARDAGTLIARWTQRQRKLVAVAFSLSVHVLFVLCLLIHQPAGLSGSGNNGQGSTPGDGMAITLVDGEELSRELLTVKPASEDKPEDKIVPLDVAQPEVPLILTQTMAIPQVLSDPSADSQPDSVQDAGRAGSEGHGGPGASGDDLWGAIAPCWNRMADGNTLPVTLDVSFSADGNVASPPVIEGDATTQSSAQVQRSETIAMQALAACGAYTMAENRQDVRISFPRP